MNRESVHFHDGPLHGDNGTLGRHVDELIIRQHGVPIGAYVRDPGSAGARCMDWHPEYEFEQIVPAPRESATRNE